MEVPLRRCVWSLVVDEGFFFFFLFRLGVQF